jgi:hypothetical protein
MKGKPPVSLTCRTYGSERKVPMTGVCLSAWRTTGKKDLGVSGWDEWVDVPEQTDKADKLDADADHRPLCEDEDAAR